MSEAKPHTITPTDPGQDQEKERYASFDEAWAALGKKVRDQLGHDTWLNLYISKNGEYGESFCLSQS